MESDGGRWGAFDLFAVAADPLPVDLWPLLGLLRLAHCEGHVRRQPAAPGTTHPSTFSPSVVRLDCSPDYSGTIKGNPAAAHVHGMSPLYARLQRADSWPGILYISSTSSSSKMDLNTLPCALTHTMRLGLLNMLYR